MARSPRRLRIINTWDEKDCRKKNFKKVETACSALERLGRSGILLAAESGGTQGESILPLQLEEV